MKELIQVASWVGTLASSVFSLVSIIIAGWLYMTHRRRNLGDLLMKVFDRLEERRELKGKIYGLKRKELGAPLGEEAARDIDQWGAELDYAASVFDGEKNIRCFFLLYGDVFLRSVYIIAPYVNLQRKKRGAQFLLPISRFAIRILKFWEAEVKKGYPDMIRWREGDEELTPESIRGDKDCARFLGLHTR